MRTLLIILLTFSAFTSYSVMPKCDSTKVKVKIQEPTKKLKKATAEQEPDVRIQPNFMTLIYS